MIAYFGTGLLGSGFAAHLLEGGEAVNVWNRTASKAEALAASGARVFADPAEAARGASEIHLTLSDDAAVDGVLEPLAGVVDPAAIIVDHTTTAPSPTAERSKRWAARGIAFVHAPVFMGPKNARDGTGLMLLCGPSALRERIRPRLETMTGKVLDLGDDPSRAAAFKLFGNLMLLVITGGLGDLFRLGRSLGIEPHEVYTLFNEFNPGNAIGGRGKAMADGNYDPGFELTMARKDARLMIEEAARHGAALDVIPAVAAQFDRFIAAGQGSRDMGIVGSTVA